MDKSLKSIEQALGKARAKSAKPGSPTGKGGPGRNPAAEALAHIRKSIPLDAPYEALSVSIVQLCEGDRLLQDIVCVEGTLLLAKGFVLDRHMVEKILELRSRIKIRQPVIVVRPKNHGVSQNMEIYGD